MPAALLHLEQEGASASAPGEEPVGGRQGRIDLIGTLSLEGEDEERLQYRLLEGACRTAEVVVGYLDALAPRRPGSVEAGGR